MIRTRCFIWCLLLCLMLGQNVGQIQPQCTSFNFACISEQHYVRCVAGVPDRVTELKCGSDAAFGSTSPTSVCYPGAEIQNRMCGDPPSSPCTAEGRFSVPANVGSNRDYYQCTRNANGDWVRLLQACPVTPVSRIFCPSSASCIDATATCAPVTPAPCSPAGRSAHAVACRFYYLCDSSGRRSLLQCPEGTFYDDSRRFCTKAQNCGVRNPIAVP